MTIQDSGPAPVDPMAAGAESTLGEPVTAEGTDKPPLPPPAEGQEQTQQERIERQFAALARKERAFQQRVQQFKESLRTDPDYQAFQQYKKVKESGDWKQVLQFLGTDYNRLTKAFLGEKDQEEQKDPLQAMQERIDQLENQLKEKERKNLDEEYEHAKAGAMKYIQQEIEAAGEEFELVRLNNAFDMVYDVIAEHNERTGEILDVKVAAKAIEDYLEKEQLEAWSKSKKLLKRLVPEKQEESLADTGEGRRDIAAVDRAKTSSPKTLSSKIVAQGTSVVDDSAASFIDDREESLRRIAEKWKSGAYSKR